MKTLLSFLLALICYLHTGYAQQTMYGNFQFPEMQALRFNSNDVGKTVTVYTVKKNKRLLAAVATCPQKGELINSSYRKNGTVSLYNIKIINDSNRTTLDKQYENGKFKIAREFLYTDYVNLTQYNYYAKDSVHPEAYVKHVYAANGKIKTSTSYNQKNDEKHRYEYDYYENGSRKETRYYRKGKLKDRWLFDCDWKGERDTHKTSDTKICKNKSYDNDSNIIEIEEYTTKNKVRRMVSKTAKDGSFFEQIVYNANGKMRSKYVYQYNSAHKLIKTSSYGSNGTIKFIELYTYNDNQLLLSSSRIDKTGSTRYRKEFVYN
jgi:hypothetical protein